MTFKPPVTRGNPLYWNIIPHTDHIRRCLTGTTTAFDATGSNSRWPLSKCNMLFLTSTVRDAKTRPVWRRYEDWGMSILANPLHLWAKQSPWHLPSSHGTGSRRFTYQLPREDVDATWKPISALHSRDYGIEKALLRDGWGSFQATSISNNATQTDLLTVYTMWLCDHEWFSLHVWLWLKVSTVTIIQSSQPTWKSILLYT